MASILENGTTMTTSTTSTTPQFQIVANPNWPTNQSLLLIVDGNGSTPIFSIFQVSNGVHADTWGDNLSSLNSNGQLWARLTSQFQQGVIVTVNPGALWLSDGLLCSSGYAAAGVGGGFVRAGSGAPSGTTVGAYAQEGDVYFNSAGASGTRLYQCTAAGSPGTWQPIAGI